MANVNVKRSHTVSMETRGLTLSLADLRDYVAELADAAGETVISVRQHHPHQMEGGESSTTFSADVVGQTPRPQLHQHPGHGPGCRCPGGRVGAPAGRARFVESEQSRMEIR